MVASANKRFLLVMVLCVLAAFPLFAQDSAGGAFGRFKNESEMYYISVPIDKVYLHQLGYVVSYRSGYTQRRAFIPLEWFSRANGKANLVKIPTGNVWPYLVVYYRNGEFSHVVLNIKDSLAHQSWGTIPGDLDLSEEFKIDELRIP